MPKTNTKFNPLNMSALTQDAFRTLRMNISFSGGDKDISTVAVTSTVPNEGKTSVSIGLGIAMAEAGQKMQMQAEQSKLQMITQAANHGQQMQHQAEAAKIQQQTLKKRSTQNGNPKSK